jgi:hypothetical protein
MQLLMITIMNSVTRGKLAMKSVAVYKYMRIMRLEGDKPIELHKM